MVTCPGQAAFSKICHALARLNVWTFALGKLGADFSLSSFCFADFRFGRILVRGPVPTTRNCRHFAQLNDVFIQSRVT